MKTLPGKLPLKTTRAQTPKGEPPPDLKTKVGVSEVDVSMSVSLYGFPLLRIMLGFLLLSPVSNWGDDWSAYLVRVVELGQSEYSCDLDNATHPPKCKTRLVMTSTFATRHKYLTVYATLTKGKGHQKFWSKTGPLALRGPMIF